MKLFLECYPCLVKQAVAAVSLNGIDSQTQFRTLKEVLKILASADERLSPSDIAGETNRVIRENTGVDDLYHDMKEASHALATEYLEDLRDLASQGEDPLQQALKVGAAGNIIDVVHVGEYDLWEEVTSTFTDF